MDEEYKTKDRLQDILLSAIYNSVQEADLLIFKGGTAIRKIYGIDRYSDDLDFNLDKEKLQIPAEAFIYDLRDKCIAMLSPLYDVKMYIHESREAWYNIDATLKDNSSKLAKIHIEISTGRIYRTCLEKRVVTPDATYFASVMDINEMLAEKIRAIYTRRNVENIARDMVDIAFLTAKGGEFDLKMVNEKLREMKHKPFSAPTFSARMNLITDNVWQKDLGGIMKVLPDRDEIAKQVMEFTRRRSER